MLERTSSKNIFIFILLIVSDVKKNEIHIDEMAHSFEDAVRLAGMCTKNQLTIDRVVIYWITLFRSIH